MQCCAPQIKISARVPSQVPAHVRVPSAQRAVHNTHASVVSCSSSWQPTMVAARRRRSVVTHLNPQDTIWVTGGSALGLGACGVKWCAVNLEFGHKTRKNFCAFMFLRAVAVTLGATVIGTLLLGRAVAQVSGTQACVHSMAASPCVCALRMSLTLQIRRLMCPPFSIPDVMPISQNWPYWAPCPHGTCMHSAGASTQCMAHVLGLQHHCISPPVPTPWCCADGQRRGGRGTRGCTAGVGGCCWPAGRRGQLGVTALGPPCTPEHV